MSAEESIFTDHEKLDEWLVAKVRARQSASPGLSYREALLEVARENPALMQLREALYRRSENQRCGTEYTVLEGQLLEADNQIRELTREAVAQHPGMSYGQAFRLALSEHPDVFQHRERLWRMLRE